MAVTMWREAHALDDADMSSSRLEDKRIQCNRHMARVFEGLRGSREDSNHM